MCGRGGGVGTGGWGNLGADMSCAIWEIVEVEDDNRTLYAPYPILGIALGVAQDQEEGGLPMSLWHCGFITALVGPTTLQPNGLDDEGWS